MKFIVCKWIEKILILHFIEIYAELVILKYQSVMFMNNMI